MTAQGTIPLQFNTADGCVSSPLEYPGFSRNGVDRTKVPRPVLTHTERGDPWLSPRGRQRRLERLTISKIARRC